MARNTRTWSSGCSRQRQERIPVTHATWMGGHLRREPGQGQVGPGELRQNPYFIGYFDGPRNTLEEMRNGY